MDDGQVHSAPPWAPIPDHYSLKSNWQHYLIFMRGFLAWLEKHFEKLGKAVTANPKVTILISLVAVSICAVGLVRFNFEGRASKLFVPQNSPSMKALEIGSSYFQNSLNARQEEVILLPRNADKNVVRKDCLEDATTVMQVIESIPNFKLLCKRKPDFVSSNGMADFDHCQKVNILELLGNVSNSTTEMIQQKLTSALTNISLLMSNGRNLVTNLNEAFADVKFKSSNQSVSAKALRIIFFMQQGHNSTHEDKIMEWEKSFISRMKDLKSQLINTDLYYTAERSMDDAISESSSSDVSLVSITFTVMITFACLMLSKFVNPIRGHNWLAMSGVFSTALGILAGIGAAVAFGVPFISLVGIAPFLVVSIGIDDMFILVDEYDRQSDKMSSRDRVKFTLSKVGSTITMTTLTDVVAFYVSTTTSFPAIRYFCICVALCISIEFVLQITMFVAFMTFDSMRIYQKRCDLLPMLRVRDRNGCNVTSNVSFADRVMHKYGKLLLKWPMKAIVILLSLCMIGGGIFGCLHINNEFNRSSLALPGSYFLNYVNTFEKNFHQTIPVDVQVTKSVDYSNPVVRKEIAKSVQIAYDTGYYISRNISWITNFEGYIARSNISGNGADFNTALASFLSRPEYLQHRLDVITDNSNNIVASRITVFYKDITNSEFHKNAMIKFRNDLKSKLNIDVTISSNFFIYFEQYAVVVNEVIWNLVAVSVVVLIIMFPFCIHPLIVIILIVCFAALIVQLFGLMYLWDVELNSISMINLVMAIGFTVDYVSHVAHAVVISREDTVNERIVHALGSVGTSVLLGGVSTFLGMSLTGFAKSTIFKIFFKMFVGIILFGLYNGLVLLPVLLSIFSKWLDTRMKTEYLINAQDKIERKPRRTRKRKCRGETTSLSILGMSTRFPLSRSKERFWELLENGINTVSEYPKNRGTRSQRFEMFFNPSKGVPGKHYVLLGSYLEEVDGFDYRFFGISEAEATSMDPQQRLLLQGTYEAVEDAGMTVEELQQCCTGVYTGIMNMDFGVVTLGEHSTKELDQFSGTGSSMSITANRISFAFNLSGPSMAFDTACSSSLTALSVACDHLEKGVIDVAVVGTANILLDPLNHAAICKANMLSPDGKCKAFDESADGYGRGEGVVVFILKATDFVVNRSEAYGEIISWGVNNDGQTAAPITAPSVIKQTTLMSDVLEDSGIDPSDVQYIEMHGTGTYIGDLVETSSAGEVYGYSRDMSDPILIGSIKTNFSHTESTAGLASIAKVCLMMEHKQFVPTIGMHEQAVRLQLEDKRLQVCTDCSSWPPNGNGVPRMAAVNCFGFGGSNGHILIREKEEMNEDEDRRVQGNRPSRMLVLSTKSAKTLVRMAEIFGTWLNSVEDNAKSRMNLCYTMSERRTKHSHRLIVNVTSLKETSIMLKKFADNPDMKSIDICSGKTNKFSSKVAFVFGGQGSQWLGMAGDILSNNEISATIRHVDQVIKEAGIQISIVEYLSNEFEWNKSLSENLVATQLSIFALQYSVAQFMMNSAGIQPVAVSGHSLGDITAACIANVITLNEAVRVISIRAKVQEKCQKNGAMAAVGLSVNETTSIIEELGLSEKLSIAAENDKSNVTISGDEDAINEFEMYVKGEKENVFIRKLNTTKAFHSHHMDAIKQKFMKKLRKAGVAPKNGRIKFFSTTDGNLVCGAGLGDEFWWRNLRNPVLFNASVTKMMKSGIRVFIEVSPRPVVSHYMREIAKQTGTKETSIIQALPKKDETERLKHLHIHCIGKMFTLGYAVNFDSLQDYTNAKLMRYPCYPWDEHHLWPKDEYATQEHTMLLLGAPISINKDECIWENEIDLLRFPYIHDHQTNSIGVLFPGAGFIELAFEAAIMENKIHPLVVRNVQFKNILPLNENVIRKIRCTKRTSTDGKSDKFEITHLTGQGEIVLSTAEISTISREASDNSLRFSEAYSINSRTSHGNTVLIHPPMCPEGEQSTTFGTSILDDTAILRKVGKREEERISLESFDKYVSSLDFVFGERFKLIDAAWGDTQVAVSRLKLSKELMEEMSNYIMHPCIIDACLQTKICLELKRSLSSNSVAPILPIGVDEITVYPIKRRFDYIYCTAMQLPNDIMACNLLMTDEKGNCIMRLNGFRTKEITSQRRSPLLDRSIYNLMWSPSSQEQLNQDSSVLDCTYILICFDTGEQNSAALSALHKLGVNGDNIASILIHDANCDIQEKLIPSFSKFYKPPKTLIVLNMLPLSAHTLPLEASSSQKAEWLCFESTLEIHKLMVKLDMNDGKIISVSCNTDAVYSSNSGGINAWEGISRGMAVSADLETRQRVISADLQCDVDENAFCKLITACTNKTIEDRIIIKNHQLLQPVLERYNFKVKGAKDKDQNRDLFKEQDDFYLSWSQLEQAFELKRLAQDNTSVLPGFVEINVTRISSVVGQTDKLLEEIKQYEPNKQCQCIVGNITAVDEGTFEFDIGDEVIAFISSKWLKSRIRVSVEQVVKKPTFLSREEAVVICASFAFSWKQLESCELAKRETTRMYVAGSDHDRGICWMIGKIAESIGINVTMSDISNQRMMLQELADDDNCWIDYLVCSSELHPNDIHRLIDQLHNDSIVIFINFTGRRHPRSLEKAAKVVNVSSLNVINPEKLKEFIHKDFLLLRSILDLGMPNIRTEKLSKVLATDGKVLRIDSNAMFDCLNLETEDDVSLYIKAASLDYQGLKDDRTYIVAGGTRGIGLKTVEWMASRGAHTIIVLGVSPISPSSQMVFDELKRKFTTNVIHIRVNIANEEEMRVLDKRLDALPPVAGVINSAGILDDKEFTDIDRASYRRVMGPKVNGTLNLHHLMEKRRQELDFFVLYSSAAAIFGNRGQTSYSAANGFLNSFANYRRHVCGKPCLSLSWGAMGGAGMLDRNERVALILESAGFFRLDIDQGIKWMEEILVSCPDETSLCICDMEWEKFLKLAPEHSSLFNNIHREMEDNITSHDESVLAVLSNAPSREEQEHILLDFIKKILVTFTGGAEEEIDCYVPLVNYGVDSVGASLFKSQILHEFNIDIEVFYFVLPETTPVALTNVLLDKFNELKHMTGEPQKQKQVPLEEENGFLHRRGGSSRRFYSFRTVAPHVTYDDKISLPDDYLTAIYDPPDAIAKIFIVHPSHRYAGVFQAIASGMKHQELFSLYAFGYQDPGFIGEDYKSARILAEACTELLLREDPSGPYFLAGYSFGGYVAIEMATILQNMGRTVVMLTMIDTLIWIPEVLYNSRALMDSSTGLMDDSIVKQVEEFFERIALTQLNMTKREYIDDTSRLNIQEIAEYLSERANRLGKEIPDSRVLLQSILNDYQMADKSSREWYPPEKLYKGPVLFIKAEICLCQKRQGNVIAAKCSCSRAIGTSFERWSYHFTGDAYLVKCPGDHFTMVEKSRGKHVGNVLATSASLTFRNMSSMGGRIKLNANHTVAKEICKSRGITVYMIRKSVLWSNIVNGSILFDEANRKIIFQGKDFLSVKAQINVKDVVNIRKLDLTELHKSFKSMDFSHVGLHSGFMFQQLNRNVAFMCSNKRDFKSLGYLIEAIYSIRLPF